MSMFISFIIPHYNISKQLLTRCIASITRQGMPQEDYEILIIDDGSKELPTWISKIYDGGNLRLIPISHSGPGGARNRGMEEAHGDYIMFVDADDYLMTNGELLLCLEYLKNKKPQILRFRQVVSTNENYPKPKKRIKFTKPVTGAEFMTKNNLPGSPCTYIFLREAAISKGIKFPTNIFHEDEEFNTILHYYATSLVECNASLYHYSIREGSTTTNKSADFAENRLENMFRVISRIHQFKETFYINASEAQKSGINRKLATLAVDAIINMIYLGKSDDEILDICSTRLAKLELYPLPKLPISAKYRIFRILSNSKRGMKIIRRKTLRNSSPKK